MRYNGVEKELSGGERQTTNNRMEMMAAIAAIEALRRPSQVHLHTDSTYLKDGITKWIHAWKARGWRTANKKPVKNIDLWQRLEAALKPHEVRWTWGMSNPNSTRPEVEIFTDGACSGNPGPGGWGAILRYNGV